MGRGGAALTPQSGATSRASRSRSWCRHRRRSIAIPAARHRSAADRQTAGASRRRQCCGRRPENNRVGRDVARQMPPRGLTPAAATGRQLDLGARRDALHCRRLPRGRGAHRDGRPGHRQLRERRVCHRAGRTNPEEQFAQSFRLPASIDQDNRLAGRGREAAARVRSWASRGAGLAKIGENRRKRKRFLLLSVIEVFQSLTGDSIDCFLFSISRGAEPLGRRVRFGEWEAYNPQF